MMSKLSILFLGLCFISYSCQKQSCPDSVKAKFHDATGIGGCGMIIELNNGKFIEPRNLDDFNIEPQDGEKIWVSYHLAQNVGTVCMMGDIVIIDCISKR